MLGLGIGITAGVGRGAGGDPVEPGEFHPINLDPVAWYSRNDLTTMLQSIANSGQPPVTSAGQPVALAMDLTQPMGSEMVTNGTFDSDITGWESTAGWPGGTAIWTEDGIQVTTDNYQGKLQQLACETGKTYLLRFRVVSVGGGASSGRVYVSGLAPTVPNSGAVLNLQNLAVGQHAAIFTATGTTHSIGLSTMQPAGVIVYDDISCVEIPGYHMTQTDNGKRPVIKNDGGNYYLDFDGSDDELTTTFPDLGGNCTVARSIPGVGAEILTGQTISGVFADSTDSHVLFIFDGPLGSGDTAKLAAWLDGVADGTIDPAPPEEGEEFMRLLMESGDEMLLESGDPILLEDE